MTRISTVAQVISVLLTIGWNQGPMLVDWIEISQSLYTAYDEITSDLPDQK